MNDHAGRRAVFLDRDGTVIVDRGYLADPAGVSFEAGVPDALRALAQAGWLLVLATNQSGVARGYFGLDAVVAVNARLQAMLAVEGVTLDAIEVCPHSDEDGCDCRKPKPGMLLRAAERLGIDLSQSLMIGDKMCDLEAGRRAGVRSILVKTGAGSSARELAEANGFLIVGSLREVSHMVLTAGHRAEER